MRIIYSYIFFDPRDRFCRDKEKCFREGRIERQDVYNIRDNNIN